MLNETMLVEDSLYCSFMIFTIIYHHIIISVSSVSLLIPHGAGASLSWTTSIQHHAVCEVGL